MLPAPGETSWPAAVVESERRVAGEVFERNGHIDLDWRKRASMVVNGVIGEGARCDFAQRVCDFWRERGEGEDRWFEACQRRQKSFICGTRSEA